MIEIVEQGDELDALAGASYLWGASRPNDSGAM